MLCELLRDTTTVQVFERASSLRPAGFVVVRCLDTAVYTSKFWETTIAGHSTTPLLCELYELSSQVSARSSLALPN